MPEDASFAGVSVCVVGNINRDVTAQGVPHSPELLRDGETPVTGVVESIGGGGANSACAAAALGADIRFLGKIGDDPLGERLRQALEGHGVHAYLARGSGIATGTTVALGFATGHRHFLSCLPNNEALAFEDLDPTALDGCAHLLRADPWFSQAMLEGGNRRLLVEARQRGLATSLDINFDPHWSTGPADETARRKELLRGVLDQVDVAHGNIRELCEFTDSPGLPAALERLGDCGVGAVVVHMGAGGAGYFADGKLTIEPPIPATDPVRSTGTGDVLSACMILLHAREDLSIREKLRLANGVVREYMEGRRTLIPTL